VVQAKSQCGVTPANEPRRRAKDQPFDPQTLHFPWERRPIIVIDTIKHQRQSSSHQAPEPEIAGKGLQIEAFGNAA
jgi:hypothetical protein